MRFTFLSISMVALSLGCASAQAQQLAKIRIGTEGAFQPWNFTEASGEIVGYEIDLAKDLCARMKATCEFVPQDWDGMIPALNAGKFDAIMAGMSITDERKKAISFSRPYAGTYFSFIVPEASAAAKLPGNGERVQLDGPAGKVDAALAELKTAFGKRKLGVQVSTVDATFLEKYFGKVAKVVAYKTVDQRDLDLTAGRIDAGFSDVTVLRASLERPEFKGFKIAGPSFTGGVLGTGVGVGLRKSDAQLEARFNEAIAAAVADGTVRRLSEKWFKLDITPQ